MCGITGIIAPNNERTRAALRAMTAALIHRGPDDAGEAFVEFGERVVGLGHRRLAIIDLSPLGHQPMVHPDSGDPIIFNGEIYNFQTLRRELESEGVAFKSHSDTEVILHGVARHGAGYLDRLEGMYALAYLDRAGRRVLLARDPVGIKPLYVAATPSALLFASEVRGILASGLMPKRLDRRAVAGFLAYGAVQEPYTIIEGIEALPPGGHAWFNVEGPIQRVAEKFERTWRYPPARPMVSDAIATVRDTLNAAVRDHLISDVPVGVFLSSGLDSTIVAGLAARHTPRLRTFTVGFADQPDLSEAPLAAETARRFGTAHRDIQITGPQAEQATLDWLAALDQPSADGLNTYIISKAVRGEGIIVALSGLGGDELFGGYSGFARIPRMVRMMRSLRWVPAEIRSAAAAVATIGRPSVARKARDIARSSGGLLELYLQTRRTASNDQLAELGIDARALGLTDGFLPREADAELPVDAADPVWTISALESRLYMGNTLLRDSDTNAMAHGLEIRVPLLDRRMLDLAHSLPGDVRLPGRAANKHLLRAAFGDLLRPELLQQKKRGFTLPVGRWMMGPLRGLCDEALGTLKTSGLLRPQGVDAIWSAFAGNGDGLRWSRAFSLVVLGLYVRRLSNG